MTRTYIIALGGNIGNTSEIFNKAIELINSKIGVVKKFSSLYKSKPLPTTHGIKQDPYLNAVLSLDSSLDPIDLLRSLQKVEEELGRDRENYVYWGPRTIDLDIISAGDLIINTEPLQIPHPRMLERDFVLIPLQEIDETYVHPITLIDINTIVKSLRDDNCFIESKFKD